jgi:hypothetical protein
MQKRNAQTIPLQSNVVALANIVNPSSTAFMGVWGYSISASANCNIGFLNGTGFLIGYQTMVAGVPLVGEELGQGAGPIFTVDPNSNLVIGNPNTVAISGYVRISN